MNLALKSALSHFQQKNGEVVIGGRSITAIARQYGTPLYIYDRAIIKQRAQALRKVLPEDLQINYAVKANPNIEILGLMSTFYDGFDIASRGEMQRAVRAGQDPGKMSFAGPGKSPDELKFAIENGIGSISIESEREAEHIISICKALNTTTRILIRVNPRFELSKSGMKMGGGPKQFGIDSERVPNLITKLQNDEYVKFTGIHIFSGSQNLQADKILETCGKILGYADDLVTRTRIPLQLINLGGGFGIPYFAHEKDLDLNSVGNGLKTLVHAYQYKLPDTVFKIELGRFLVGECGIYLSRVLYRKISHGQTFLITDGGMHHHLAASGNFGQSLVRRPMPITVVNRQGYPLEKVHVVGALCTPLDTFGFVELPQAQEGDLVAVLNSGAYGFSASPLLFLSHEPPKEIMV